MTDLGRRFVTCFQQAMDDAGLPRDPEFRAAMTAYVRWAVDDVLAYGPPGSRVAPGLPMPRWSWDGLVDDAQPNGHEIDAQQNGAQQNGASPR